MLPAMIRLELELWGQMKSLNADKHLGADKEMAFS